MNKIEKLIEEFCPQGVEFKMLGEIADYRRGSFPQPYGNREWYDGENSMPFVQVVDVGHDMRLVSDTKKKISKLAQSKSVFVPIESVVVTLQGSIGRVAITQYDSYVDRTLAIFESYKIEISKKYFAHQLQIIFGIKKESARGSTIKTITKAELTKFKIPIPPLTIQKEIVKILDNFTQLEAELEVELEAELEARKKQYEHCREQLLMVNDKLLMVDGTKVEFRALGEIGKVSMCKRIFKSQTSTTGQIPFYKIGTFGNMPNAFISQEIFDEYRRKFSFPKKGDVLLSASGTIGRRVIYDGKPAYFQDSNIIWIDNDESKISNRFLFYLYSVVTWQTEGGTIKRLYNDNLKKIKIPIPPLAKQQEIVAILDKFDALVNDILTVLPAEIVARKKQYNYYRNQLLNFKPLEAQNAN